MNAQPVEDSKVWRRRAAEARGAAQQMDDPETKRILEEIAKSYDRIAALGELRERADAKKTDEDRA